MKKLSVNIESIRNQYGIPRMLEICSEAGFDAIDFDLSLYGSNSDAEKIYERDDDGITEYFSRIKERAAELGLFVGQTHGRFRIHQPDEDFNILMRELSRKDLLATAALGAPFCVIHNVASGFFPDATAEFMHEKNNAFFRDITPFAERYGVSFALETFGDSQANGKRIIDFFGDALELKKSFDSISTKNKALCMDTGHTNKAASAAAENGFSVLGVADAIRLFGKDLKVLHLNDNNGFSDQHTFPGSFGSFGGIDWHSVFEALADVGYDGTYNFELTLSKYGNYLEKAVKFLGGYLRAFIDGKL